MRSFKAQHRPALPYHRTECPTRRGDAVMWVQHFARHHRKQEQGQGQPPLPPPLTAPLIVPPNEPLYLIRRSQTN